MSRKEYNILDSYNSRYCSKCQTNKELSEFNLRRKDSPNTYNRICRECAREIGRNHFKNNKEKYSQRRRNYRHRRREFIIEQKNKPCVDCGIKYPYYVMDFDHRDPSEKRFLISQAGYGVNSNGKLRRTRSSNSVGERELIEELAKCDVVCSNCHRERTHHRRTGIE